MEGGQFKSQRKLVRRVGKLVKARAGILDDCRACIVRQYARRVTAGEELPCRERVNGIRGFPGSTDADRPLGADELRFRARTKGERGLFVSSDPAVLAPVVGTESDPTLFGATVEFCAASGTVVFDLPANFWRANGAGTVFKYRQGGSQAHVKVAVIAEGRALKVATRAVGLPLDGELGAVGVRVITGSARQCAYFAPDTVLTDEPGSYLARATRADAIADCGNEALGCAPSP